VPPAETGIDVRQERDGGSERGKKTGKLPGSKKNEKKRNSKEEKLARTEEGANGKRPPPPEIAGPQKRRTGYRGKKNRTWK